MEDFVILYGQLAFLLLFWYILWTLDIVYGYLVYIFSPFWYVVPIKSGNPVLILKRYFPSLS
jgi:hypothetical protein